MFDLRKILFGSSSVAAHLAPDIQESIALWRALPDAAIDDPHFHMRYVVVDVASAAGAADEQKISSIAALGLNRTGTLDPADSFMIDHAGDSDAAAVDRQLTAFLRFVGKAPLITFHSPYVLGVLQRTLKARLGVDYAPPCIDLVWLMPSLFGEFSDKPLSLDRWLEIFGVPAEGRRDAMGNVLHLARLFQRALVRARHKEIDTARRLLEESHASNLLRRTH